MAFVSTDELDKFSYEDCKILKTVSSKDALNFKLEALIVGARNSQNTNYTESYADEAELEFSGVKIDSMVIEGIRKYDAEDNLVEEIADREVSPLEMQQILNNLEEAYLYSVEYTAKAEGGPYKCILEIDTGELNEAGVTDPYEPTYELHLTFDKAVVTWEKYLNRVER